MAEVPSHPAKLARLLTKEVESEVWRAMLDVGLRSFAIFCARGSTARYHGTDIVPEFVGLATTALADDVAASVSLADAEDDTMPSGFDYAVRSGVFNNRIDDN